MKKIILYIFHKYYPFFIISIDNKKYSAIMWAKQRKTALMNFQSILLLICLGGKDYA